MSLLERMNDSVNKAYDAANTTYAVLTGEVDQVISVRGNDVPTLATRVRDYINAIIPTGALNGDDGVGIESIEIRNQHLFVKLQGTPEADLGKVVPDDAVGVQSTSYDLETGELTITLTDGQSVNVGNIRGRDGVKAIDAEIRNGNLFISFDDGSEFDAGDITQFGGINANDADINEAGELVVLFSDGTTTNVGRVLGFKGERGVSILTGFIDPSSGQLIFLKSDGTQFRAGQAHATILDNSGNTVNGATIDENGHLILQLASGDYDAGQVKGVDGVDGVGVQAITVDGLDGNLMVTLTDGTIVNAGLVQNTYLNSDIAVTNAVINGAGELVLDILVDGVTQQSNVGKVVGDNGTIIGRAAVEAGTLNFYDDSDVLLFSAGDIQQISVTDVAVNETGNLIVTLSDLSTIDAGVVKGLDGIDGVGVSGAYLQDGHLFITFTDTNIPDADVGNIMAPVENAVSYNQETGELTFTLSDGQTFTHVVDGTDGLSPVSARIEDGILYFTISDGSEVTVGGLERTPVSAEINASGQLVITLSDDSTIMTADRIQAYDGDTITGITIDTVTRDLVIAYSINDRNDATEIRVPLVYGYGITLVEMDQENRELRFTTNEPSNNLYRIDIPYGIDGKSITNIALTDNDLRIDTNLPYPDNTITIPLVKGKTVESVYKDLDGNLVFEVTGSDPIVFAPVAGEDGVTVSDISYVDNDLSITLSDDRNVIVPAVKGTDGDNITAVYIDGTDLVVEADMLQEPLRFPQIKGVDAVETITSITFDGVDLVIAKPEGDVVLPAVKGDGIETIEVSGTDLVIITTTGQTLTFPQKVGIDGLSIDSVGYDNQTEELILSMSDNTEIGIAMPKSVNGKTITSIVFNGDDLVITTDMDAPNDVVTIPYVRGQDGRNIETATINENHELVITMDDATQFVIAGVGVSVETASITVDGQLELGLSNGSSIITEGKIVGSDGNGTGVSNISFVDGQLTVTLSDAVGNETVVDAGNVSMLSVTSTTINPEGHLILTMSDDSTVDVGRVRGDDGIYISDQGTRIDENQDLIITLTDGRIINAGNVRGEDGRTITSIDVVINGDMIVYYSDDTVGVVGNVGSGAGLTVWNADNLPYVKDRVVIHEGGMYMSLIDNNSDEPPSGNWNPLQFGDQLIEVRRPVNLLPVEASTAYSQKPRLVGRVYAPIVSKDDRLHRQFQIDVVGGNFSNPVYDATENSDHHEVMTDLTIDTQYIWRCRDISVIGYESQWSEPTSFNVPAGVISTPSVAINENENQLDAFIAPRFDGSQYLNEYNVEEHTSSDWEVFDVASGEVIHTSMVDAENLTSYIIPYGVLENNKTYRIRAKYRGVTIESGWSEWYEFKTNNVTVFLKTPIVAIKDGLPYIKLDGAEFESSRLEKDTAFAAISDAIPVSLVKTEWELVDALSGTVIETKELTSVILRQVKFNSILEDQKEYRTRVRYTTDRFGSVWSDYLTVQVSQYIDAPVVTTQENVLEFPTNGTVFASAFNGINETHQSTDWEVRLVSTDELIASSYGDTVNMTSYTVNVGIHTTTDIKIRARYNGTLANSQWSDYLMVYTAMAAYSGPGPQALLAGTMDAGFFGEVSTAELFTGTEVASSIGLTLGNAQNDNEPWLKFALDGSILFIAKKPYRNSVTWTSINTAGAVYNTVASKTMTKGDDVFRVTLMTGANTDPTPVQFGDNPAGTELSEWNRLMYKIHIDDPSGTPWASYIDDDIVLTVGDGRSTWTQETQTVSNNRVGRGNNGILSFFAGAGSNDSTAYGWRPVLRLL